MRVSVPTSGLRMEGSKEGSHPSASHHGDLTFPHLSALDLRIDVDEGILQDNDSPIDMDTS